MRKGLRVKKSNCIFYNIGCIIKEPKETKYRDQQVDVIGDGLFSVKEEALFFLIRLIINLHKWLFDICFGFYVIGIKKGWWYHVLFKRNKVWCWFFVLHFFLYFSSLLDLTRSFCLDLLFLDTAISKQTLLQYPSKTLREG